MDKCKNCGGELIKKYDNIYVCDTCNKEYIKNRYCEKCGEKLELIAGCGAVNFFCNKCNELKSKKSGIEKFE